MPRFGYRGHGNNGLVDVSRRAARSDSHAHDYHWGRSLLPRYRAEGSELEITSGGYHVWSSDDCSTSDESDRT